MPLPTFYQPAYYCIPHERETETRAHMCYILNFGYNHQRDCHKLLDEETGRVVYSRDVTWHHPEVK